MENLKQPSDRNKRLTPKQVLELLEYDPATGEFWWKERDAKWFSCEGTWKGFNARCAGKPAFTSTSSHGNRRTMIMGLVYPANQCAWAIYYGEWPPELILHKNGNVKDDRITNLALGSASQRKSKNGVDVRNKTGVKGVSREGRRFLARIKVKGKDQRIGLFDTLEEAAAAYRREAIKEFGEWANPDINEEAFANQKSIPAKTRADRYKRKDN